MFKDLFDKGKCLVGLHQGDWNYLHENDCTSSRVCIRCGIESRKVEHCWGGWDYTKEKDCDQQRSCLRCQTAENRAVHLWQEPVWRYSDKCDQVQVCSRCAEEKWVSAKHLWEDWNYLSPDECAQAQICSRCGSPSSQHRTEHLWGEWQHSEYYGGAVRVCRRCGELTVPSRPQTPAAAVQPMVSSPDSQQGERDARLVGHWRFTDAMSSSGGFSQATDYHRVLAEDGSFLERHHSCGSFGESWSEPEYGQWQTEWQVLHLEYDNGSRLSYQYHLEGNDTLFFPQARHQRLWHRVG